MDPIEAWIERKEAALGFKLLNAAESGKVALEGLFRPLRKKTLEKLHRLQGKRGTHGE